MAKKPLAARISDWLVGAEARAQHSGKRRLRAPVYLARVLFQVVQQWVANRGPQNASSLAFQTSLSIVPLLGVALEALRISGQADAQSSFVDFISDHLVPVSRAAISDKLLSLSNNVSIESLGLIGLGTAFFLAMVLFSHLEKTVNHIWRADRRRPLWKKAAVFLVLISLVTPLLGASLVQAARVGLTTGFGGFLLSTAATMAGVFLANLLLPRVRVSWSAAFFSAVFTTVLLEIAKYAFRYYVTEVALERYGGIYGAVAVVPLWLFWIYWSWMVILIGVEVAHAVQNLAFLERTGANASMMANDVVVRHVNAVVALRLLVQISKRSDSPPSVYALCRAFNLADEVVERILLRLERAGLIVPAEGSKEGFALLRPASEIAQAEVIELCAARERRRCKGMWW